MSYSNLDGNWLDNIKRWLYFFSKNHSSFEAPMDMSDIKLACRRSGRHRTFSPSEVAQSSRGKLNTTACSGFNRTNIGWFLIDSERERLLPC